MNYGKALEGIMNNPPSYAFLFGTTKTIGNNRKKETQRNVTRKRTSTPSHLPPLLARAPFVVDSPIVSIKLIPQRGMYETFHIVSLHIQICYLHVKSGSIYKHIQTSFQHLTTHGEIF
jgi:hypothetical protein